MNDPTLSALADFDQCYNIGLAILSFFGIVAAAVLAASVMGRRGFD